MTATVHSIVKLTRGNARVRGVVVLRNGGNDISDGQNRMERTVLPFGLDRASKDSLKDQLVEGIREAVRMGFYRPGDTLPSLNRMADELGVSEIVIRSAYRRLAAEGIVVSRPRIGSVIHPPKTPIWRGHVLCVMKDFDFNPLQAGLVGRLRERLGRNGFLFSQATAMYSKSGKFDCTSLASAFKRPVDLVVVTQGGGTFSYYRRPAPAGGAS